MQEQETLMKITATQENLTVYISGHIQQHATPAPFTFPCIFYLYYKFLNPNKIKA
ncbi:hypothetical protein BDE36_2327 [Arcticibacter tournemirensis]|nr:hypothetical protein BDE36_2327 [Arcticibacter tournemirensis]